jgi:hypothetical protein
VHDLSGQCENQFPDGWSKLQNKREKEHNPTFKGNVRPTTSHKTFSDMQFLVTSDTLGKNIQGLSKMMNGKASLAILDHYLFEVEGNIIQYIVSDGENMMRTTSES